MGSGRFAVKIAVPVEGQKKGLHRNAAPFKIQYPMKNRRRKYSLAAAFKVSFDEQRYLFDERMFFGDQWQNGNGYLHGHCLFLVARIFFFQNYGPRTC